MGSINSYKYPDHDIEEAVEIVEIIHNKGISQPELLADQLGHTSYEGGAFRNKLTSLRRYNLISGRGELKLTSLANRIVAPKPGSQEREYAIAEAVKNVQLLEKLYERLDYEPAGDDIWYQIVEITDADRAEAQEKADTILDLYETGLKYVEKAQESDKEDEPSTESDDTSVKTNKIDEVPQGADATLITPDAQIDIRSRATYIAAKALFEDIGKKYEENDSDPDGNRKATTSMDDFR